MELKRLIKCCALIALTGLAIGIINFWAINQSYFTLAPLFAILAMGIYHGGTISAIGIGLLIIGYSFYASPDIIRAVIISVSVLFIVVPVVILRRVADNANMILVRLRGLDIMLSGADDRWAGMSEAERLQLLRQVKYSVAHLLTLAMGWHELAKERNQVLDDYGKLDT